MPDLSGPRRWREQRWLIDSILRTDGLEWDQPRIGYTLRPMGIDAAVDFERAKARISKFADITPAFLELAAHRRQRAEKAEQAGRLITARENYFYAALHYVSAEWPIWDTTASLVEIDDQKNACYEAYGRLADHHVERVEIPYEGRWLPAWWHLPVGYAGGRIPTVISCGGMDAPKELNVSLYGDKFLQRGFAVLAFDGPGQGESPIRGITFTPSAWIDAGDAIMRWCLTRPEVDPDGIAGFGLSFGSYWMTQIAATQPRLKGVAVGLVCHEPGGHMIFEMASPSFKARYMWMSGLERDEAAFDVMAEKLDLRPLVREMTVPWLVIAGDSDELSPIEHSYELAALAKGPAPMLIYHQGRHALSPTTPSVVSGPHWVGYAADWLFERVSGSPAADVVEYVGPDGAVARRPHPKENIA